MLLKLQQYYPLGSSQSYSCHIENREDPGDENMPLKYFITLKAKSVFEATVGH